jgi:hypothetical protein
LQFGHPQNIDDRKVRKEITKHGKRAKSKTAFATRKESKKSHEKNYEFSRQFFEKKNEDKIQERQMYKTSILEPKNTHTHTHRHDKSKIALLASTTGI